jgi:hypothetical protein
MLGEIGVQPHHIEAILNHYSGHRSGVAGEKMPMAQGLVACKCVCLID